MNNREIWELLNDLENKVSGLNVVSKMLDAAGAAIEAKSEDRAMNTIIGAQEFLSYMEGELFENINKLWKITKPVQKKKKYFAHIDEDGVLTIPEEIMEQMGWGEGTMLDVKVGEDGQSLIITEANIEFGGGCMGDTLTPEEENALSQGGLKSLMELGSPWEK